MSALRPVGDHDPFLAARAGPKPDRDYRGRDFYLAGNPLPVVAAATAIAMSGSRIDTGAVMFKVVTLVKRKPGLAVQDFQRLLGSSHNAPAAANGLGPRRCVLSRALLQGYAKGELLFDAVSEMWFDTEQAYRSFLQSPEAAAARDAEAAILDGSRTVVMPVDVFVIKDGAIPEGAVKNIEFVNRRPGMALEPFRAYWRDVHGPLAARIPMIRRYEQNHLARTAYQNDQNPVYDGLAVTWFSSTADMRRGTATREYAETRADEPNFLPDGHLPIIITREQVVVE